MSANPFDPYTHPADRALLGATPMLMAPRIGTLDPPPLDTARFLAASDGIYVQARTRAITASYQIAECVLPYGNARSEVKLAGGKIPLEILNQAIELARSSLPDEWAGLVLWDHEAHRYRLWTPPHGAVRATPGSCSYQLSGVDPSSVVVDLHSHGNMKAFFSNTDDRDDRANPAQVFVSMVMGRLHLPTPMICSRLVINGHLIPMNHHPFTA